MSTELNLDKLKSEIISVTRKYAAIKEKNNLFRVKHGYPILAEFLE